MITLNLRTEDGKTHLKMNIVAYWVLMRRPWIEMLSACVTLLWSLLLLGQDAFFDRAPSYTAMRQIAPEEVWGLITLALAIAQFVTPIMHGRLPKLVAIAAASSFWMFVAVMFAQVGGIKTGTAVYGALSVFLFLRAYEIES